MKNKKKDFCCWCGKLLNPGEGNLFHVAEEDEMLGIGPMGATGWLVSCLDKKECEQRRRRIAEERKREQEEERQRKELEEKLFPEEREFHTGWIDGKMHPYPEGEEYEIPDPEGEEYEIPEEGWNIYGGGTRYVVVEEKIWKLVNNGRDGDMWDANNVSTGGAGAIGYVYPATPERIDFLQKYCMNISEKARQQKLQEKREREEREHIIREGLQKMLARGITFEMVEKSLKNSTDTFCPRELTRDGKPLYQLTVREAKRILEGDKK